MGPAGGPGGQTFNDVVDHRLDVPTVSIVRVEAHWGETLDSLSVTYQSAGLPVDPVRHGGPGGPNYGNFVVEPGERLVAVDGFTHDYDGTAELNAARLWVLRPDGSHRTSAMLGNGIGTYFLFNVEPFHGEIASFFGNQGLFLDALGIFYRVI
jgi:hypothetical protein